MELLLTGRYHATLSEDGRVLIPSRLLTELSKLKDRRFVLCPDPEGGTALFPIGLWLTVHSRMKGARFDERRFQVVGRFLTGRSFRTRLDARGRIRIPDNLRKEMNLGRDLVVIGVRGWIELWEPQSWSEYLEKYGDTYDAIAAEFFSDKHNNSAD